MSDPFFFAAASHYASLDAAGKLAWQTAQQAAALQQQTAQAAADQAAALAVQQEAPA